MYCDRKILFVTSAFQNCILLGCFMQRVVENSLTTFREILSVSSSIVNNPNYLLLRGGSLELCITLITIPDCLSS